MQDDQHAVVDLTYQFVRICGDDREGAHPLACGAFPVLPQPCHAERRAVLHRDGVGLFRFALDRLPFEEAINRYDAAPALVSFSKHRLQVHGLGHRIDRASAAFWILAPIGDKAPTKRLQRPLARLVVLSDYEKLLARCPVVPPWKVGEPTIAHIKTVDDREVHRASGLYDASAHAAKVVSI